MLHFSLLYPSRSQNKHLCPFSSPCWRPLLRGQVGGEFTRLDFRLLEKNGGKVKVHFSAGSSRRCPVVSAASAADHATSSSPFASGHNGPGAAPACPSFSQFGAQRSLGSASSPEPPCGWKGKYRRDPEKSGLNSGLMSGPKQTPLATVWARSQTGQEELGEREATWNPLKSAPACLGSFRLQR